MLKPLIYQATYNIYANNFHTEWPLVCCISMTRCAGCSIRKLMSHSPAAVWLISCNLLYFFLPFTSGLDHICTFILEVVLTFEPIASFFTSPACDEVIFKCCDEQRANSPVCICVHIKVIKSNHMADYLTRTKAIFSHISIKNLQLFHITWSQLRLLD